MALTVHQTYLTQNDCYRSGGALTPQGLMLHSVGCAQPDAMAFVQSWNQPGVKACVHGFIDANTGAVYQTLPWTCRGWHGGGSSNNTHIGVEMCEPASIRYTSGANFLDQDPAATEAAVLRTYGTAVDLFAQLCRTFSLDPLGDGVILSHREGHQRGIATNHGDPEHLWSPFGLTMDIFRQAVSAALTGQAAAPASPAVPFLGRVTADALHIRSGPGTNCPIVGTIRDQGVYTIVETADGQGDSQWGKLAFFSSCSNRSASGLRSSTIAVCRFIAAPPCSFCFPIFYSIIAQVPPSVVCHSRTKQPVSRRLWQWAEIFVCFRGCYDRNAGKVVELENEVTAVRIDFIAQYGYNIIRILLL